MKRWRWARSSATPTTSRISHTATATGGRAGKVTSADGIIDLTLAMPKELGGPGNAANPETFFARNQHLRK